MNLIREQIKKAPPVVLLMIAMLTIGVGYSIFQAVSALDGSEPTPEYESAPSAAFAVPQADTIVDPQKLTEERLPDSAYQQIIPIAQRLTREAANANVTAQSLQEAGMDSSQASAQAGVLKQTATTYANREVSYDDSVAVIPDSRTTATASTSFEFFSDTLGSSSVNLEMSFAQSGETWRLEGLSVDF